MDPHLLAHTKPIKGMRKSSVIFFKISLTMVFMFMFYLIFSTSAEISERLKTISVNSLDVHDLQVAYAEEVHEWKNLLLRGTSKEVVDAQWQAYVKKHDEVRDAAKKVIGKNDEARVTDPIKIFLYYHERNFEQYQEGKGLLLKNGFNPREVDAAVKGIDRNLIEELENAGIAMQEEQDKINERVAGVSNNRIEQFLSLLAFMSLIVIWMPRW